MKSQGGSTGKGGTCAQILRQNRGMGTKRKCELWRRVRMRGGDREGSSGMGWRNGLGPSHSEIWWATVGCPTQPRAALVDG